MFFENGLGDPKSGPDSRSAVDIFTIESISHSPKLVGTVGKRLKNLIAQVFVRDTQNIIL